MKVTKKSEYAIRTLMQLTVAHHAGRDIVSVPTLAADGNLPFKFVEQILYELRCAGYVETRRGKIGGIKLSRSPQCITVGEIVRLIDGNLAPIGCAAEHSGIPCTCPDEENCGLKMIMINLRDAIARVLDGYTLMDAVNAKIFSPVSLDVKKYDNEAAEDWYDGLYASLPDPCI